MGEKERHELSYVQRKRRERRIKIASVFLIVGLIVTFTLYDPLTYRELRFDSVGVEKVGEKYWMYHVNFGVLQLDNSTGEKKLIENGPEYLVQLVIRARAPDGTAQNITVPAKNLINVQGQDQTGMSVYVSGTVKRIEEVILELKIDSTTVGFTSQLNFDQTNITTSTLDTLQNGTAEFELNTTWTGENASYELVDVEHSLTFNHFLPDREVSVFELTFNLTFIVRGKKYTISSPCEELPPFAEVEYVSSPHFNSFHEEFLCIILLETTTITFLAGEHRIVKSVRLLFDGNYSHLPDGIYKVIVDTPYRGEQYLNASAGNYEFMKSYTS